MEGQRGVHVIPVGPASKGVACGDSIVDQGVFLPLAQMINDAVTPRQPDGAVALRGDPIEPEFGGYAFAAGGGGAVAATVPVQPVQLIMSGTPGDTASAIASNVPGRITNFTPDWVVLFVGVNDALIATPLANFNASMDTILAGIAAYDATTPVIVCSIFTAGEQWAAGPQWNNALDPPPSNPGYTPSIAQYYVEVQTAVADTTLTDAEALDLRGPTLIYEAANNTPGPPGSAVGVLTNDGVHPNRKGQIWISGLTFAQMVVS